MVAPRRGDIWIVDFSPTVGREQAGARPALIVSADTFNQGPRGLIFVLPMTRTQRPYPFHVQARPDQTGLAGTGYIMCEQLRTVSLRRVRSSTPVGKVSPDVLAEVEDRLRGILDV